MKTYIFLITPLFLLSGCAAMDIEECKTANWFNTGEKDGMNGNRSNLDEYYSACQKANITPNQDLYNQGYKKGISYYCKPESIFNRALNGNGNYEVCPIEKHSLLRPYYQVAHEYYQAENALKNSENAVEYNLNKLDKNDLSAKERSEYKKNLYDARLNTNKNQYRYQNALKQLEVFKIKNKLD